MKLMLFSGLSLLALMCLFMMIWSWVLGFQGIFLWDVGLYDEHTWTFIIGYLVTIFVVVSICKILYDIFLQEKIWRWQEERKWKKIEQERREGKIETLKKVEKKPREPGLFRMWLRARKEQVCPLIKFVD